MQIEVRVSGEFDEIPNESRDVTKLNLDVTALMASVSSLTCESPDVKFNHPILMKQARREARKSTKIFLDQLFKGNNLLLISNMFCDFCALLSI